MRRTIPRQNETCHRTDAVEEHPVRPIMHHPPFATGIPHMDKIALRNPESFSSVIARHRQVERIVCGHHHRPEVGRCAHAIVTISPSVAHQVELTLDPAEPGAFNFEPPAFQLHIYSDTNGFVSHEVYTNRYILRSPFLTDPAYPGRHSQCADTNRHLISRFFGTCRSSLVNFCML
jgi:hypothetical protein